MIDNEKEDTRNGDLILVETHKEINTYDIPEFSFEGEREKTQCFHTAKKGSSRRLLYRIYSFFCVLTVLLTLIFSASELINFIMDDMGTHDMLMSRLLGREAEEIVDGKTLLELIMKQTFADLSLTDKKDPSSPPPAVTTPQNTPQNTEPPESNKDPEATNPNPPASTPKPPSTSQNPPVNTPTIPDENALPIINMDLSYISYGKNYLSNDTALKLDLDRIRETPLTERYNESLSAPLVLIVHTHTTESFMPEGATHYKDEGEIARSTDPKENMIAVGKEFARVLEENGIKAIHCTVVHDAESYRKSYDRSAETIKKYLKEYPSIQYVFDLHRDSVMRSGGELVSATASINGKNTAQVMPVVSGGFDGFEENLTFALRLRDSLNQQYGNLCRPVCLRKSIYNQDLAPVSVLIEIGTSGNTLGEAKAGAILAAEAIAHLIKNS
jgi:stage II sporulation protein P